MYKHFVTNEGKPSTAKQLVLVGTPIGSMTTGDLHSIIQAARSGDESAFARLVSHYQTTAERVARHILRTEEAAADAVQDAMIKVHRAMPRFKDGNFRSWLLRIVTNTCYDHLRRQKRRAAISLDELIEQTGTEPPLSPSETSSNPEVITLHKESMATLLDAIEGLPRWHRNVVLLVDVHGYDYAEAAQILDLPLGTVKSRLSRARSALRNELVRTGAVVHSRGASSQSMSNHNIPIGPG